MVFQKYKTVCGIRKKMRAGYEHSTGQRQMCSRIDLPRMSKYSFDGE